MLMSHGQDTVLGSLEITRVTEYSDEIAAGIGSLMPDLDPNREPTPIEKDILQAIIDSPDREQFIAQAHGRIIGVATLNLIISPTGKSGWLNDFVVSDDTGVRGKGVGSAIWEELKIWCRERGVPLVFTSMNHRKDAHDFYIHKGATDMGSTTLFLVET